LIKYISKIEAYYEIKSFYEKLYTLV